MSQGSIDCARYSLGGPENSLNHISGPSWNYMQFKIKLSWKIESKSWLRNKSVHHTFQEIIQSIIYSKIATFMRSRIFLFGSLCVTPTHMHNTQWEEILICFKRSNIALRKLDLAFISKVNSNTSNNPVANSTSIKGDSTVYLFYWNDQSLLSHLPCI